MRIEIMGREEAIKYTQDAHEEKSIIISISETHHDKPCFKRQDDILDVLYLWFDDIEPRHLDKKGLYRIMSEDDCLKIKKFVDIHKEKINKIIVHCYAGISRSSGVAMCICRYLGLDDLWIWEGSYLPNSWVVEIMNEILKLGFTKEDLEHREYIKQLSYENSPYREEIDNMFLY